MNLNLIVILALTLFSVTTLQAAEKVPSSGTELGSVTGGVFNNASLVIGHKCVKCHSGKRIEDALSAGKDMKEIQQRMEQKGVKLTADEQSVLGIFWNETPLKPKK